MADFYLLPPRPAIGEEIARLVRPYLPGVRVTAAECVHLLERVVEASRGLAFLVHREDLPEGEDAATAIRDGFGAGAGDRIVHIAAGLRVGQLRARIVAVESEPVPAG